MSKLTDDEIDHIYILQGFSARNFARSIESAVLSRAIPEGWMLVPNIPTPEMIRAARNDHEGNYFLPVSLYQSMLAAAPSPQETPT